MLVSITFPHRPSKADSVWNWQKLVCAKITFTLFSAVTNTYIMDIDKVRNLHCHMKLKYGMESVVLLTEWEFWERKMVDFHNCGHFMLRVFKEITTVSCRLKNTIRTPRGHHMIRQAERQLLNKRVRQTNHKLYLFGLKREICTKQLQSLIDHNREDLQECQSFIYRVREAQNNKVKQRQKAKYHILVNNLSRGYMYDDMVSNFSTFGGYIYDSFSGHSNSVITMVTPHTSPTLKDKIMVTTWTQHQPTTT